MQDIVVCIDEQSIKMKKRIKRFLMNKIFLMDEEIPNTDLVQPSTILEGILMKNDDSRSERGLITCWRTTTICGRKQKKNHDE